MTLSLSTLLTYYKREDIRQAMALSAKDREVAVKYDEKGFGKRPDMLTSPGDVLEFAKRGATSFHASEERWKNPMQLLPSLPKRELEELRQGWDLVLDIDCPYWELSKLIAKLMVKALNDNGVKKSVSIKFSGNKGFHIGVPFEAFPKRVNYKGDFKDVGTLFPEPTRRIAKYIVDYIAAEYIKADDKGNIYFNDKKYSIGELKSITGKTEEELTKKFCKRCKKELKEEKKEEKTIFICPRCEWTKKSDAKSQIEKCEKCGTLMQKIGQKSGLCKNCGASDVIVKFNPLSIIDVDTVLISSRHLYRMEFSLHEKSGLASVPFNPAKIDVFEKEFAKPEKVKVSKYAFLDRENCVPGEATMLFTRAYDYSPEISPDENEMKRLDDAKEFEVPEKAIPEELFPPCIKKGLEGMEDGKKRFLFLLVNFLYTAGWDPDMIEKRVLEWNSKCKEPLRDQYIIGHLRYHKQHKKNTPPPNCESKMYYKDMGLCFREYDNLCQKIKNPSQYAKRKVWAEKQNKPRARKKKEEKKTVSEKEPKDAINI